jgi:4-hydroxythreonine-4-phosphate dehydrogenase
LIGPVNVLRTIASRLDLAIPPTIRNADLKTERADSAGSSRGEPFAPGAVVLDCGEVDIDTLQPGTFSAQTGRASFQAVETAIELARTGRCVGIVTGPIQKEAWHDAGTGFLGHTELLAERTETDEFCMMLTGTSCSTVLCTIHLPLADAVAALTVEKIERAIRLGGQAMEARYRRPPRITVLGLNPHAGEGGLLSHGEEERVIVPAIAAVERWLRREGLHWQLTGPVPPDTAFTPAMREHTDVHICMYHDQGLIPLKALSFDDAVNVTLGLPIVRTSVDHGTAMDLAWQGKASRSSMLSAIEMALDLSGASSSGPVPSTAS